MAPDQSLVLSDRERMNWLEDWMKAVGVISGSLFRRVSSADRVWGEKVTEKLVWHVVKEFAAKIGVSKLAPHDLRRSCARLCRAAGGELEQIQFLLGHVSVQTTERYLGCTPRIASAVRASVPSNQDSPGLR